MPSLALKDRPDFNDVIRLAAPEMIPILVVAAAEHHLTPEVTAAVVDRWQVVGNHTYVRELEVRLGNAFTPARQRIQSTFGGFYNHKANIALGFYAKQLHDSEFFYVFDW
jgi:hypothetical protein